MRERKKKKIVSRRLRLCVIIRRTAYIFDFFLASRSLPDNSPGLRPPGHMVESRVMIVPVRQTFFPTNNARSFARLKEKNSNETSVVVAEVVVVYDKGKCVKEFLIGIFSRL